MRKLIVQEWLSVDGFAADRNGSTDFFAPGSERTTSDYREADKDGLKAMENVDTILLGANTYQIFSQFWPTVNAKEEIMADFINTTPKLVFSNSLSEVPWGSYNNAIQQKGDAREILGRLKRQEGKDMVMWGSLSLFRSLLQADLIDELHIGTIPVILGEGIRLFEESDQIELTSKDAKSYADTGINFVIYQLKGKSST